MLRLTQAYNTSIGYVHFINILNIPGRLSSTNVLKTPRHLSSLCRSRGGQSKNVSKRQNNSGWVDSQDHVAASAVASLQRELGLGFAGKTKRIKSKSYTPQNGSALPSDQTNRSAHEDESLNKLNTLLDCRDYTNGWAYFKHLIYSNIANEQHCVTMLNRACITSRQQKQVLDKMINGFVVISPTIYSALVLRLRIEGEDEAAQDLVQEMAHATSEEKHVEIHNCLNFVDIDGILRLSDRDLQFQRRTLISDWLAEGSPASRLGAENLYNNLLKKGQANYATSGAAALEIIENTKQIQIELTEISEERKKLVQQRKEKKAKKCSMNTKKTHEINAESLENTSNASKDCDGFPDANEKLSKSLKILKKNDNLRTFQEWNLENLVVDENETLQQTQTNMKNQYSVEPDQVSFNTLLSIFVLEESKREKQILNRSPSELRMFRMKKLQNWVRFGGVAEQEAAWRLFSSLGRLQLVDNHMASVMMNCCYDTTEQRHLLQKVLPKFQVLPDTTLYNNFITMYLIEGNQKAAESLVLHDMKDAGVLPDENTRAALKMPQTRLRKMRNAKLRQLLKLGNDGKDAAQNLFEKLRRRRLLDAEANRIMGQKQKQKR